MIGLPAGALVIDAPDGGTGRRVEAALAGGLSFGTIGAALGALRGSRRVYVVETRAGPPDPAPRRPPSSRHD